LEEAEKAPEKNIRANEEDIKTALTGRIRKEECGVKERLPSDRLAKRRLPARTNNSPGLTLLIVGYKATACFLRVAVYKWK